MQTTKSSNQKRRVAMALIILISALLFLASCKKEEQQQPLTVQSAATEIEKQHQANQVAMVFSLIKINHIAMNTNKPDYTITVAQNGAVSYEGRKNVFTKRTVIWKASLSQMHAINQFRLEFTSAITISNFSSKAHAPELPVLNHVITTYIPIDLIPHTYIDFDDGSPAKLIRFRTKVEEVLNVSRLTHNNQNFSFANEQE